MERINKTDLLLLTRIELSCSNLIGTAILESKIIIALVGYDQIMGLVQYFFYIRYKFKQWWSLGLK